jgi:hypothetical protein
MDPGPPWTEAELTEIENAYFKYAEYFARREDPPDDVFDAGFVVQEMATDQPERFWPLLIALVDKAPDYAMENISVGLIESFLMFHSERFATRMRAQAIKSRKFQEALQGACNWDATPRSVQSEIRDVLNVNWDDLQTRNPST